METKSFFEGIKASLIQRGQDMIQKNEKGGNGQTPEAVLANIDEYALKDVIIFANSVANFAQKVSEGTVTLSQFENQFVGLSEFGMSDIYTIVKQKQKTSSNIYEQVRELFLMNSQIPADVIGIVSTKESIEQAEKEYNDTKSALTVDPHNYDLKKANIDAHYNWLQKREFYTPSGLAYNNPTNSNYLEECRLQELNKLAEIFGQVRTK